MTLIAEKDQIIIAYSFDATDKRLVGSFEYKWVLGTGLASNSTEIRPPNYKVGQIPIFDDVNQKWSLTEDNRLVTVYSTITKERSKIDYVGPIKEGFTLLEPTSGFDTWTGSEWKDQRTDEEKELERLKQFSPLSRRQFKLVLLENNLLEIVESKINEIEDPTIRARIQIEYAEATEFHRTSTSVAVMCGLLGLTDVQINEMWELALTL